MADKRNVKYEDKPYYRLSPEERRKKEKAMLRRRMRIRLFWSYRISSFILCILLFLTVLYYIVSCGKSVKESDDLTSLETNTSTVTLIAVGDVLAHDTVLDIARTESGYDFSSLFSILQSDISSVDLAIANLETVLGGTENGRVYSGYPAFNTPDEMGDALINAGFDVITEATNHSLDAGSDAVLHCISYWNSKSGRAMMVGLYDSKESKDTIHTVTINGIKIAVLNYTSDLNGYELPNDMPYLVATMTDSDKSYITSQIAEASKEADFVIVCPHWGTEDVLGEPTESQREWAELFTEAGADLILGTHPHVIENIEWITADNGNSALCYYSLGNFVSNQQYTNTVLGGMAYLNIVKDDSGAHIDSDSAKVIPIVTHNDKTVSPYVIQTYYLADYTDELAAVHDTKLTYESDFSVETMNSIANQVFGSWIRDRIR